MAVRSGYEIDEATVFEGYAKLLAVPDIGLTRGYQLVDDALLSQVEDLQPGDFLLWENEFNDVQETALKARMTIDGSLAKGREYSANGVYFAEMTLEPGYESKVAVKPLRLPSLAVREFGATMLVNALGGGDKPSSYIPLGFYKDEVTEEVALLTRFERQVVTFDNLFWDRTKKPDEAEVALSLGMCASAMAFMHSNLLVHRESQIKNYATDSKKPWIVDLTSLQSVHNSDPESARSMFLDDASNLVKSLNLVGISRYVDLRSGFIGEFGMPYLSLMGDSALPKDSQITHEDIAMLVSSI